MDNGAVLSQDAIDALLNSAPTDAPAAPAEEASPAAEPTVNVVEAPPLNPEITDDGGAAALGIEVSPPPAAAAPPAAAPAPAAAPVPQGNSPIPPAPVYQPLPPPPPLVPPPVVAQPGKGGITREEATEIAGEAAETESAPIQASVSRISKRVDTLEMALDRIAELEEEIDRIKKKPEPKIEPDPRVLALFDRLNKLEERAKNSPVFGLYEKFACGSCGHLGEAQVRSRCGHCEKEGWFGKRSKKGSHPEHDAQDGHDADQAAEEAAVQEAVAETDDVLNGLDLNLGI
ncbi:hypothetical protein [Candidatus Lucifugimonas marina]|uniref:Uncharacterized protein n=1 Tax=Candidatus Lucifugimonas marina TaxID=3038979 RepID=A0AAJ5ZI22_9CHLR|nr:hypothetical protein [SAR202 cluster bacterium JH702]MDG0869218.1 hypothetical protein [SAR202 cluster bacterium JH639]WFG35835.1 hypothetical protein GKN94_09050 [SAR202 cluster bacterium JH545]WFG39780.1 hypothetical protein GKO48_09160 [SAR202 cluster bacterium JH1073]